MPTTVNLTISPDGGAPFTMTLTVGALRTGTWSSSRDNPALDNVSDGTYSVPAYDTSIDAPGSPGILHLVSLLPGAATAGANGSALFSAPGFDAGSYNVDGVA